MPMSTGRCPCSRTAEKERGRGSQSGSRGLEEPGDADRRGQRGTPRGGAACLAAPKSSRTAGTGRTTSEVWMELWLESWLAGRRSLHRYDVARAANVTVGQAVETGAT